MQLANSNIHILEYMHILKGINMISVVKMSVLMVAVYLLSISEVISECSPSIGKTLDVYNNNCIRFYRYPTWCIMETAILMDHTFRMQMMSTQILMRNVYCTLPGTSLTILVSGLELMILLILFVIIVIVMMILFALLLLLHLML